MLHGRACARGLRSRLLSSLRHQFCKCVVAGSGTQGARGLTHTQRHAKRRAPQVRLGTLEQTHAENEWTLRAYTRSARKSKLAEETGD